MATQYTSGTFSETKEFALALPDFFDAVEAGTARAFHVGTPEQIEKVKERADLQTQIDELAATIQFHNATQPEGLIKLPTADDVKLICGDE